MTDAAGILIIIAGNLALFGAGVWYITKRYGPRRRFRELSGRLRAYVVLSAVLLALITALECASFLDGTSPYPEVLLRWSALYWGLYVLAYTDARERKIPNNMILALLALRGVLLVYEVLDNLEFWKEALLHPLGGALMGGFIMLAAMVVSRNGLGMGDVKLFFVIGAYVGASRMINVLFLSLLVSALTGLALLITKKAGMKDTVPMGPFAFIGAAAEFILMMVGGS